MAKRIPNSFVDDLLARIDIVDVIERVIPLKKRGANYFACCPFHSEKSPSFTVSPTKQIFHCFGCGVGGNAIRFVMQFENLEFVESIEFLATLVNTDVPYESSSMLDKYDKLNSNNDKDNRQGQIAILERVARFYQKNLWQTKEGQLALDYLKKRGLMDDTIKHFELGYAPNSLQSMFNGVKSKEEYQLLEKVGILIKKNQHYHARFFNRIMFPIRNKRGQLIGFGGRAMDQAPSKYLNSPENELFHKGKELYYLCEARKHLNQGASLFVVEGYMDVVALVQVGINTVVAALGTSATTEHLKELLKLTREKNLVFCFDGDLAGRKAAWRALENLIPLIQDGMMVMFMFLPEGEDPDSFIRKEGKAAFLQRKEQAIPLSSFLVYGLAEQNPITTPEGKSKFVKQAKELLKKFPESTLKQLILKNISETVELNLNERSFSDPKKREQFVKPVSKIAIQHKPLSMLSRLLSLLIQNPGLIKNVADFSPELANESPGWILWFKIVTLLKEQQLQTTAQVLEHFSGLSEYELINKFALKEWPIPVSGIEKEFQDTQTVIQKRLIKQEIKTLIELSKTEGISQEKRLRLQMLLQLDAT